MTLPIFLDSVADLSRISKARYIVVSHQRFITLYVQITSQQIRHLLWIFGPLLVQAGGSESDPVFLWIFALSSRIHWGFRLQVYLGANILASILFKVYFRAHCFTALEQLFIFYFLALEHLKMCFLWFSFCKTVKFHRNRKWQQCS